MGESSNPEREQRILTAAADLIAHYGYDKTSVEEIAREAGVSKGAIYLHFKSKEALFEALLLRDADEAIRRFYELIDADPDGVTLFNIYRYTLVVTEELPLLKAIYTHDRRLLGDYLRRQRDTPLASQMVSFSADFVRHYQQAGLIRTDLDAEMVAYLLIALRNGVFGMDEILPSEHVVSISVLGETLAEMLARGLEPADTDHADQTAGRKALADLTEYREKMLERFEQERRKSGA